MKEQEKTQEAPEVGSVPESVPGSVPESVPEGGPSPKNEPGGEPKGDPKETFIRLAADFENYKKRTQKEFSEQRAFGKRELLEKLLSLSDTFELGLASAKDAKPEVLRGLLMIKGQLAEILKSEGVSKFGEAGEAFDPFRHEAIEFVEGSAQNDGKIETVIQCGYSLPGGKILRHATVRVFKNPAVENAQNPSQNEGVEKENAGAEGSKPEVPSQ